MKTLQRTTILFVSVGLLLPFSVFALTKPLPRDLQISQISPADAAKFFAPSSNSIVAKTFPTTPGPNQDVTITLTSFAININNSQIIWYVNGEAMKQGVAETTFVAHTGDFGSTQKIDVVIVTDTGARFDKQIILAPGEVDLLWEAQTYTPPFYKGKALPSDKSAVKVVAIPRFNETASDPAKYYYKWTLNRLNGVGEGIGKNTVLVSAASLNSRINMSVDVSLAQSGQRGSANKDIATVNPKVMLYERAPLLGIRYGHAITQGLSTNQNEIELRAVPYYFSIDDATNGLLPFYWFLNSQQISNGINPASLVLTKSGEGTESINIMVRIRNTKHILQDGNVRGVVSFSAQ